MKFVTLWQESMLCQLFPKWKNTSLYLKFITVLQLFFIVLCSLFSLKIKKNSVKKDNNLVINFPFSMIYSHLSWFLLLNKFSNWNDMSNRKPFPVKFFMTLIKITKKSLIGRNCNNCESFSELCPSRMRCGAK